MQKVEKNVYSGAKRKLDMGYSICIYPEGLVPHPDVYLAPFKNGAFSLAIQYQMPIVPITLPDCKNDFLFNLVTNIGRVLPELLEQLYIL